MSVAGENRREGRDRRSEHSRRGDHDRRHDRRDPIERRFGGERRDNNRHPHNPDGQRRGTDRPGDATRRMVERRTSSDRRASG